MLLPPFLSNIFSLFYLFYIYIWASQVVLVAKNPPADAGDIRYTGSIYGSEDPLEEVMATHLSILAWEIPWTEEPVGYSPWGCKESDTIKAT